MINNYDGGIKMIFFIIGYLIMVVNEGFVILRHVCSWFDRLRSELHEKFGAEKVKRIHGYTDWSWIILVGLGIYLDFERWPEYAILLGMFWGIVLFGVYVPKLYRKLRSLR